MSTPEKFHESFTAGNIKNAMKDADAKSRDLWYVPYDKLRVVPGFNVRVKDVDYKNHVRGIADSIEANGYYPDKPMAGYVIIENGEEFIAVTDGHCRYEACGLAIEQGAPLERIPVVVKQGSTSMADLTVALVMSNSGKPLSPYEIALVCKRLVDFGWDSPEIARKLTFTRTYVDQLLSLMAAPVAVQKQVRDGKVSASLALDLVKQYGEDAAEMIDKIATEKSADSGKKQKKVTKRDLAETPGAAIKKKSKELHEALLNVLADDGFKGLHAETRKVVKSSMEGLPRD